MASLDLFRGPIGVVDSPVRLDREVVLPGLIKRFEVEEGDLGRSQKGVKL